MTRIRATRFCNILEVVVGRYARRFRVESGDHFSKFFLLLFFIHLFIYSLVYLLEGKGGDSIFFSRIDLSSLNYLSEICFDQKAFRFAFNRKICSGKHGCVDVVEWNRKQME